MEFVIDLRPLDISIKDSSQAAAILREHMTEEDHEEVWALYVNTANKAMEKRLLGMGGLDSSPIDVRRIVKHALLCNASGIILAHNHPSGKPDPSAADIKQTERLRNACSLFDITLLDHVVMCTDKYFSFSEEQVRAF